LIILKINSCLSRTQVIRKGLTIINRVFKETAFENHETQASVTRLIYPPNLNILLVDFPNKISSFVFQFLCENLRDLRNLRSQKNLE